jgi:hypothetical protein
MAKDKKRQRAYGEELQVGDVVVINAWQGEMKITIDQVDDATASKGGFMFPRVYDRGFKAINPKIDSSEYSVWEPLP